MYHKIFAQNFISTFNKFGGQHLSLNFLILLAVSGDFFIEIPNWKLLFYIFFRKLCEDTCRSFINNLWCSGGGVFWRRFWVTSTLWHFLKLKNWFRESREESFNISKLFSILQPTWFLFHQLFTRTIFRLVENLI